MWAAHSKAGQALTKGVMDGTIKKSHQISWKSPTPFGNYTTLQLFTVHSIGILQPRKGQSKRLRMSIGQARLTRRCVAPLLRMVSNFLSSACPLLVPGTYLHFIVACKEFPDLDDTNFVLGQDEEAETWRVRRRTSCDWRSQLLLRLLRSLRNLSDNQPWPRLWGISTRSLPLFCQWLLLCQCPQNISYWTGHLCPLLYYAASNWVCHMHGWSHHELSRWSSFTQHKWCCCLAGQGFCGTCHSSEDSSVYEWVEVLWTAGQAIGPDGNRKYKKYHMSIFQLHLQMYEAHLYLMAFDHFTARIPFNGYIVLHGMHGHRRWLGNPPIKDPWR